MYKNYRVKKESTTYTDFFGPIKGQDCYWVVCEGEGSEELKIAKIPSWIKHPKAVAKAIALSLNEGKYKLTDLI